MFNLTIALGAILAVGSLQPSDWLTGYLVEHQPLLYISALLLGQCPAKLLSKTSNPGWENCFRTLTRLAPPTNKLSIIVQLLFYQCFLLWFFFIHINLFFSRFSLISYSKPVVYFTLSQGCTAMDSEGSVASLTFKHYNHIPFHTPGTLQRILI